MALKNWSTTASSNASVDSINFAENQAPSTVNDSARNLMADVRSWYEDAEWRNLGHTVTYVSASSFTVSGDKTSVYVANRPIRCTDASTLYGKVSSSSYSAPDTTVNVTLDSGSLSASLTAVALGQDPTGDPIDVSGVRGAVANTGNETIAGNKTFSGSTVFTGSVENDAIVKWAKGADVVSAGALTLGTDGNYFDITSTNAITSIGTLGVGTVVKLHFDDALTLTHHATDLILPGGANITTAAGDEAELVEYATGDWRCTKYTPAAVHPKTLAGAAVTTAATGTSDTSVANTAFVQQELNAIGTASSVGVGVQKLGAINVGATATYYLCAAGQAANTTEANAICHVNDAVTCSTLYARSSDAIVSGTITVTVRKNGADQSLTCQLSSSAQQNSDLANSFDLSPGDYYTVKAVTSGLDSATKDLVVSLVFKYKGTDIGASFIPLNNTNGGITRVGEPANSGVSLPSGTDIMLPECVTGGLASYNTGNITLVEAVVTSTTVKRTATASTVTTAQSPINRTEYLHGTTYNYYAGSSAAVRGCWSFRSPYSPGVAAPGIMAFASYVTPQGTTSYMQGWAVQTATTSEGNVAIPMPAGKARKLRAYCGSSAAGTAPPGAETIVVTVRKNGVDTALTCTLNNANQYAFDLVNSVSFTAGDRLSISAVTSAATGNFNIGVTIEYDDENAA